MEQPSTRNSTGQRRATSYMDLDVAPQGSACWRLTARSSAQRSPVPAHLGSENKSVAVAPSGTIWNLLKGWKIPLHIYTYTRRSTPPRHDIPFLSKYQPAGEIPFKSPSDYTIPRPSRAALLLGPSPQCRQVRETRPTLPPALTDWHIGRRLRNWSKFVFCWTSTTSNWSWLQPVPVLELMQCFSLDLFIKAQDCTSFMTCCMSGSPLSYVLASPKQPQGFYFKFYHVSGKTSDAWGHQHPSHHTVRHCLIGVCKHGAETEVRHFGCFKIKVKVGTLAEPPLL